MGGYRSSQHWKPEELGSLILSKMKEMAETHLGTLVKDAVLTVPADFTTAQRSATREAGQLAGLNVVGILDEPVAAAIAYGLDKKEEGNILVFDMGNGTVDVSVLSSEKKNLRVKSSASVKFGEEEIEEYLTKKVAKDIQRNLLSVIEKGINFKKALDTAKTDKNSITDIVFAGGLTKFPVIQKTLQEFFAGSQLHTSINPEEVVATGAAIVAKRITEVLSEGAGGAVSVQDKGAQVQDTMEDPLGEHQKNQEDPSLRIDPSLSPAKNKDS